VNGAVAGPLGVLKAEKIYAEVTAVARAAPEQQRTRALKKTSLTFKVYLIPGIREDMWHSDCKA
jgi:hypothetical protein